MQGVPAFRDSFSCANEVFVENKKDYHAKNIYHQ